MTRISGLSTSAYEVNKINANNRISKKTNKVKKKLTKCLKKLSKPEIKNKNIGSTKYNEKKQKFANKDVLPIKSENDRSEGKSENTRSVKTLKPNKNFNKKDNKKNSKKNTENINNGPNQNNELSKKFITFSGTETSSVLFLQEKERVLLEGSGMVQCLVGSCCINGFEFNSLHAQKFPVYSLGPHYSIEALTAESIQPDAVKEILKKYGLTNVSTLQFMDGMKRSKEKYAVIMFEKIQSQFLAKMAGLKSYNKTFKLTADLKALEGTEEVVFGEDYCKVLQNWKQQATSGEAKMVVVGERNTGKSSFIRYLLNHSLSFLPQVAYLECDPGQTEFAAPGCVALNIVTTPILGLPFTSTTPPVFSCFTGSVTPTQHPHHFMACVHLVLQKYVREYASLPLIVNTMGWMQGRGLELLCAVIEDVRPSLLLQLYDQHFKPLLPSLVSKLHSDSLVSQCLGAACQTELQYQLLSIQISFNSKRCSDAVRASPTCLRNLKLLSCLQQSVTSNSIYTDHLLGTPLYCMQGVGLRGCHGEACTRAPSVVSLCSLNEDEGSVCESVGMGVVHAFQPPDRVYITTNVPPPLLSSVNLLLVGSVKTPQELLVADEAQRPVDRAGLNYQMDVFGSTSLKALRKFIPRKR